ncbi:MAG: DUF2927 domain-containing protein, partial [Paracoccaceae bacterium]
MVSRSVLLWANLPALRRFTTTHVTPPTRSNAEMVQDFLDLFFQFESGAPVAVLSRFDVPIDVRITPPQSGHTLPDTLKADLAQVLRRLRREAGIDISWPKTKPARAPQQPPKRGTLLINIVPRADIARVLPNVACFAVPRAVDWAGFRRGHGTAELSWATVRARTEAAIFVPG